MSAFQFTPENITAILRAASKGANQNDVSRISGANVHPNTLRSWIARGKRDEEAGATTAYSMFYHAWHKARKSAPKVTRPDIGERHAGQIQAVMEVLKQMEGN